MRIPEDKIRDVLNSTDIVDLISESVMLKRTGSNFVGLCPFHSEKTPSFSVSPSKQIFHCFGCGVGGNAFSFVMKFHGITFPESVRMLAKKSGIQVETEPADPAVARRMKSKENLYRLNKNVMNHFTQLLNHSPAGAVAREYLDKRGLTQEIRETFHLGFAPDSWDTMVRFVRSQKVGRRLAEESGLVLKKNSGTGYYDRFRNRIIFPIIDVHMQIAGFGGRVMDDAMPKYLNSPETPVYSKKRILYGLHQSKQFCRQTGCVHIVEGYFDFLSLFQHGVTNVVASLGTALTRDHVKLLKGHANRAVLVFDSDEAGINAARKSIDTFMTEGLDVRILVLPSGDDPDSFVMAKGADAFLRLSEAALTAVEFLTENAIRQFGLSVEGKIKIIDQMKDHLAKVGDSTARSLYIRDIAQRLGVDEDALLEKVRNVSFQEPINATPQADEFIMATEQASDRREKQILSLLLQYPELIPEIESNKVIDYFYSDRLKHLGRLIIEGYSGGGKRASDIVSMIDNKDDHNLLTSLAITEVPESDTVTKNLNALIRRIILVREKDESSLITKIRQAEKKNNSDLPLDLLRQRQEEIRKLHGYNN